MNAIPKFSEQIGSTFSELSISDDFVIQGTRVYFDLVQKAYSKVTSSISAVIEANEAIDSLVWNSTNDPQNDVDVDYDKLEVAKYNIAKVWDFDDVLAQIGQPFFLTKDQVESLNEILKAHFEEEKIKELAA
ncbi:hypothetical protein [Acinetobacter silvestris]|uniref:Uncharacterized protein n=1 Tax=Acinetobacter silvestris TaxID=1977882 RepID=A0A1Y3CFC2_9GAMM|nr:hypothetical protein [Acinetobacter silvestris]OTG65810.1 hypothetical protein B9T28_06305 [Acinetobacter silvestris]